MIFNYSTLLNPHEVLIDFIKWKLQNKVDWNELIEVELMAGDESVEKHNRTVEQQLIIFAAKADYRAAIKRQTILPSGEIDTQIILL